MTGTDLIPTINRQQEIAQLARRYRRAGGVGMQVLNLVGGQAENLLERLPDPVKDRLEDATVRALTAAMSAAHQSRRVVPDQKPWLNTALTTAMGAVGGAGGVPTALAELPVTTTVLLRAIQGIAEENGYAPTEEATRKECLAVFSSAGPLARDDGADMAFLSARLTLNGATVHGMITRIAPQLASVLGQKLAAQTIPVIGAAAGAATNYAYTSYYQEMAQVHFRLMRLSGALGVPREGLIEELRQEMKKT